MILLVAQVANLQFFGRKNNTIIKILYYQVERCPVGAGHDGGKAYKNNTGGSCDSPLLYLIN